MGQEYLLQVQNVTKQYGDKVALNDFSMVLASGDNRHSGSGEKRQFWSTENSHLQFE